MLVDNICSKERGKVAFKIKQDFTLKDWSAIFISVSKRLRNIVGKRLANFTHGHHDDDDDYPSSSLGWRHGDNAP